MNFRTRPHFEDRQIVQYNDESINLSGTTIISPTVLDFTGTTTGQTTVDISGLVGYLNEGREYGFRMEPPLLKISGSTGYTTVDVTGYVLTSVDEYGNVGWQPMSGGTSGGTDTYVTGGTLNGSYQLTLGRNDGSSTSPIDLSALSDSTYWTSGSSGSYSVKVVNDSGLDATGDYALAEGNSTIASGNDSHAEGRGSIASGSQSHAEGSLTTAIGNGSHAEGSSTIASGDTSHAEGVSTIASGYGSHAEGLSTTASGEFSHVEGRLSIASGDYSHAEGLHTDAIGNYSHAEGGESQAIGNSSHAEGSATFAVGNNSHSEGDDTIASGDSSHAEGRETTASGDYSHAEGYTSQSTGTTSHAEGYGSIAGGYGSHAEGGGLGEFGGLGGKAYGQGSHAEGISTIASGLASHAEGNGTLASGSWSHAEGRYPQALGTASHAEGYNTTAGGTYSHSGGYYSTASGDTSFIHSYDSLVTGNRSVVLGGQNITGTTNDTVYTPNLTVREDHILHSDTTLEVTDIPSSFEDTFKGSYTEFNWTGLTTQIISNSNPEGYSSFLLGNLSNFPTTNEYGFLSYFGSGYTRTGTPTTGTDFYRDKVVLKGSDDTNGVVFSLSKGENGTMWWEIADESVMILHEDQLGIGLNTDGTETPQELLHVGGNVRSDGQIYVGTVTGGTVTTGNTFTYDCDLGMTQKLDLQGATTGATISFTNQKEGSTYTLVVVQGSGLYDLTFPSGWWLNDTAPFDFTTLADNDRTLVTSTYLDGEWYFAVKELTFV